MEIWDTAGQERYRSITKSYYRKADGIILCYRCDSKESFEAVTKWMGNVDNCKRDDAVQRVLVATASDRLLVLPEGEVITSEQGQEMAQRSFTT